MVSLVHSLVINNENTCFEFFWHSKMCIESCTPNTGTRPLMLSILMSLSMLLLLLLLLLNFSVVVVDAVAVDATAASQARCCCWCFILLLKCFSLFSLLVRFWFAEGRPSVPSVSIISRTQIAAIRIRAVEGGGGGTVGSAEDDGNKDTGLGNSDVHGGDLLESVLTDAQRYYY